MTVLDLGCGWGAFAKYICEQQEKGFYKGVTVHQITLSEPQARVAEKYGTVEVADYRDAKGQYDAVISIGLFEHVGEKHYKSYMKTVWRCLKPEGIAFIHTNGLAVSHKLFNPWINKYIFPYGMMPSIKQIAEAAERLFIIEDIHNIGTDYIQTLRSWWFNCHQSYTHGPLRFSSRYGPKFWRMWKFYLLFSAASFRNRDFQLYHVVLTKKRSQIPPRCA